MQASFMLALLRHILGFVGGAAVANGYTDDATVQTAIGAVMSLAAVAWSFVDKKQRVE